MSKLLVYTIGGQKIGIDIQTWNEAMLSGNTAFITIADTGSTPSNYTDISSIIYWSQFGNAAGLNSAQVKKELTKIIPLIPTPEEIIILQEWGIYIDTSFISGETATFWGDFRVEGKLWVETIRRVKQIANQMYVRVEQPLGLAGSNFAGLIILNPTGATTGYTSVDTTPSYYLGVNKDGVLIAGWSGKTQPVAVGGAAVTNYFTSANGTTTTTSTTAVLISGMQFTSVPAGTYMVNFGTSLSHNTSGVAITTSIYANNALVANSELIFQRGTQAVTAQHGYSNFRITLPSTQNVEIRWRTASGTATANTNRYLTLLRVS